jgi:hypothetical protein
MGAKARGWDAVDVVFVTGLEAIPQLDYQRPGGQMVGKARGVEFRISRRDIAFGQP